MFTACGDQAPATPKYKLLQLRQCLTGEALKSIESLKLSATAYYGKIREEVWWGEMPNSHIPGGKKITISQSTSVKSEQRPPPPVKRSRENDELIVKTGFPGEGDKESTASSDATLVSGTTESIALRTIHVYLKNGSRRLRVNALLDDASSKTYINSDVAAKMGLQGRQKKG